MGAHVRNNPELTPIFGATGVTSSLGSAVGAANSVLVAVLSSYDVSGVDLTLTDNQGNTYSLVTTWIRSNLDECGFFVGHNIANAPTSLVFNWTGGGSRYIEHGFIEFSGLANAAASDTVNTGAVTGTAVADTLITAAIGETLALFMDCNGALDITPETGLTRSPASGTAGRFWLYDEDAGSAGSKPVGATWAGSQTVSLVGASYGPSGGASTAAAHYYRRRRR